ncbi:hypothetical protein PO124_23875 [Bacillus licheniformis]|nr:hypothetical protein [Bacillus licheniformis]
MTWTEQMELTMPPDFENTPIESLEQHIDIHVRRYELIKIQPEPVSQGRPCNRAGV